MSIHDLISNVDGLNDETVVYAKKINGKFRIDSEVVLLELSDEELELLTREVSARYCPGFDYFLEGYMIKEMVEEIRISPEFRTVEQQVQRVIYYAEFDA